LDAPRTPIGFGDQTRFSVNSWMNKTQLFKILLVIQITNELVRFVYQVGWIVG